jgi:uncharacterized RDD family membrane protein YckC
MSEEEKNPETTEISYQKPYFHRRIFANLIDIIIFAFVFACLFLGARQIVTSSNSYQAKEKSILQTMNDSGLYVVTDGQATDLVSYLEKESNDFSASDKKNRAQKGIGTFIAYVGAVNSSSAESKVQTAYDDYRLSSSLTYQDVPYFIRNSSGTIEENSACPADYASYFSNAYAPFLDNQCQGYLLTLVPGYVSLVKYESQMLYFVEILPSYALAGLLVYLVPPLCNPRNHATLGKMLYHIGLADSRLLSVSFWRFIARFSIFYFAELILSLFTFGVPYLISFTLMVFTKNRQSFPDYLLGIFEIDLTHSKLYKSFTEIALEGVSGAKKPIDFKMEEEK